MYHSQTSQFQRERERKRGGKLGTKDMMVVLKVVVSLYLVGIWTIIVDARFDPNSIIIEMLMNNENKYLLLKSSWSECCICMCTKSKPPQCRCLDNGENCYSGYDRCLCAMSISPQECHCLDIFNSYLRACGQIHASQSY